MGVEFPTLVIAVTSDRPDLRSVCRQLRRADSFYIEASRLMMHTKRSNVADWWKARETDILATLPHVIALFNAQLVSCSASTVVQAVLQHGSPELKQLVQGVQQNTGNAKTVMQSSELYKFIKNEPLDSREAGSSVKDETVASYKRVQEKSDTLHLAINRAMMLQAEATLHSQGMPNLKDLAYERQLRPGLQTDAIYSTSSESTVAIEFHHKAAAETSDNKVAIYILGKLKEYAINYGIAKQ